MSLFKRKSKDTGNDVYAFISGNTIPITEVNDPVFSAKTLGDGLAIIPSGELICAPCTGTISMVAEGSNHAVGMTLANGASDPHRTGHRDTQGSPLHGTCCCRRPCQKGRSSAGCGSGED